jgi:hypothetical protein
MVVVLGYSSDISGLAAGTTYYVELMQLTALELLIKSNHI